MGICVSCRRRERKAPEKRPGAGAGAKGAAADLLPRRSAPDHLTDMANSISNIKMTNPIKGIVSKRKKRYIKDGFNLDLSYITDRVIAMGFPAEKLEGVYRNHIDEVYRFLEHKHKDRYKIYNLCSERSYDSSRFHERVAVYPFHDHTPPTIELIQPFCEDVHQWLCAHPENVIAVHCKAGKGRTGTMVCCYLLYSGQKATADEALSFYGTERTHDEKGVTIPSQRRYVEYYAALVRLRMQYRPCAMHIRHVVLTPPPALNGSQCTLELDVQPLEASAAFAPTAAQASRGCTVVRGERCVQMSLSSCTPLSGDVRVEVYRARPHKMMRRERLFHFWFNTFFVAHGIGAVAVPPLADSPEVETFKVCLNKWQLDDAHKDKHNKIYSTDFKVELIVQRPPATSAWSARLPAPAASSLSAAPSSLGAAPPPSPSPASSPTSSERTDSDTDNDEHWDSGDKSHQQPEYWDDSQEKTPLCPNTDNVCYPGEEEAGYPRCDTLRYPTHCEYGAYAIQLGDTASVSSGHTSATDLSEGKIPKVSSDHTLSSLDKSPTEGGKKKYMFFKKDSMEGQDGHVSRPRLSLGDVRASWREFSDRHFGTEHSKDKRKTRNGQTGHDNKDD